MRRSFLHSINKLLRPCLINLVGIHKLRDNHNDFKCKILVDESSSSNHQVTEVEINNQITPYQKWMQRYDKIYNEQLENYVSFHENRNYLGKLEFDESFTHSKDFQKKVLSVLTDGLEDIFGIEEVLQNYLSFAVSINGKMVLKKAYRYQDRENLVPAKEDMVGAIGSITKTLTAMMIMKLIEEEEEALSESEPTGKRRSILENRRVPKITLDSYVEDILTPDIWPEHFVKGETDGQKYKITIRQLLLHESGLRSNKNPILDVCTGDPIDIITNNNDGNFESSVNFVRNEELFFKPGTKCDYSNYGYQLLALVYEKRTGRSFVEDLRDELAKMGLYDTDFNYREYLALDRARGYRKNDGVKKGSFIDMSWHEASYGLVSTVSDVVKYGNIFASCLLNNTSSETNPLSKSQVTKMVQTYGVNKSMDVWKDWINWYFEEQQGFAWSAYRFIPFVVNDQGQFSLENQLEHTALNHEGSTMESLTSLSLDFDLLCLTETEKVLQKKPILYPLGENLMFNNDFVVGALIGENLERFDSQKLLFKLMNLVLFEYRQINNKKSFNC